MAGIGKPDAQGKAQARAVWQAKFAVGDALAKTLDQKVRFVDGAFGEQQRKLLTSVAADQVRLAHAFRKQVGKGA